MSLMFYKADTVYCEYLRQFDFRVPIVADGKEQRPFIGILFTVNTVSYFAPLSSPKEKHKNMKEGPDLIKINGGLWGVINLNNMIPVLLSCIAKADMRRRADDSPQTLKYKDLLNNQLDWCNSRELQIVKKAGRLHRIISEGLAQELLQKRCCCFTLLEQKSREYLI